MSKFKPGDVFELQGYDSRKHKVVSENMYGIVIEQRSSYYYCVFIPDCDWSSRVALHIDRMKELL